MILNQGFPPVASTFSDYSTSTEPHVFMTVITVLLVWSLIGAVFHSLMSWLARKAETQPLPPDTLILTIVLWPVIFAVVGGLIIITLITVLIGWIQHTLSGKG